VPVRDAATVVLLRDGPTGIEAWLLRRVTSMVFAAGMTVFPGGRVDPADGDLPVPAEAAQAAARRLGCEVELAHALIGAAVRETFEETGVLLTTPSVDLAESRADVEEGRLAFGDLLRRHNLLIDPSGLALWARWITPLGEVRRYDTRFFVAALPAGAHPRDVTSESSEASWTPIVEAIAQTRRGERSMLAPTMITLGSLVGFGAVAEALAVADERSLDPVVPVLSTDADGRSVVELPDGTTMQIPRAMLL
jgi:8-oxo-dGTP pyrophosphatase MutT (NUDIX family)